MNLSKILNQVFRPLPQEKILVISDYAKQRIGNQFFSAFRKISDNVFFLITKPTGKHGAEPDDIVKHAFLHADVFLAVTEHSLTHTNARKKATDKGVRGATLPGFVPKMFPALGQDVNEIKTLGNKLKNLLEQANEIKVTNPSGTNLTFSPNREIHIDDGDYTKQGAFGNLPAGEVFFAPVDANGTIVIDLMKNGKTLFAPKNTKIEIQNNRAISICRRCLLSEYFETVKNADNLAEFGIGLNKKAKLIGYILQDEKVFGTVHFAFGSNFSFGGKIKSDIHIDGILLKPTVEIDGKTIMKNGRLILD